MGSYLENLLTKTTTLSEQVHPRPVARFEPLLRTPISPTTSVSEQGDEAALRQVIGTSTSKPKSQPVQQFRPLIESDLAPDPVTASEIRSSNRRTGNEPRQGEESISGKESSINRSRKPVPVTLQSNPVPGRRLEPGTIRPTSREALPSHPPVPEEDPKIPVITPRETLILETNIDRKLEPMDDRVEKEPRLIPKGDELSRKPKPTPKLKSSMITPKIQPFVESYSNTRSTAEKSSDVIPTVHVTIGRIEVRAIPSSSSPSRTEPTAPSVMTLDEYLQSRKNGWAG